jgi:hypothetical protein
MKAIALALCATLVACSSDRIADPLRLTDGHPPTTADIAGSWSLVPLSQIPGSQFGWLLVVSGAQITGVGNFAGEAGPFGTMTVHGTASGDSLHVDVEFVYDHIFSLAPYTGHFDGVLTSRTEMSGNLLRAGGQPEPMRMTKGP